MRNAQLFVPEVHSGTLKLKTPGKDDVTCLLRRVLCVVLLSMVLSGNFSAQNLAVHLQHMENIEA